MADAVVSENQKFSIKEVFDTFQLCVTENKEVKIDQYVAGWRGLVRFLNSLGTVFYFIAKDAASKIQIMVNYRNGENGAQYATIQSMVKYELENDLVDLTEKASFPESGCRTLLRLHRALHWLELFLERLRTSTEDDKTSVMCSESYNESLALFHPYMIRKASGLAFCTLPRRYTFFEVMNVGTPDQVVAMLGEALPLVSEVYQLTQDLYSKHNILDIP
ncbi:hypothetical protein SKAU_G00098200 [Synaphobranchus kaupii]|uniref:Ceramide-1-phosphate transfer protein n=1 Tax=Synaphobranchus kaupii TaxID=118154 RepID=A0A9Q1FY91_SYNKA|nr:hypothetical protein SKAU_G00098200 [Synaphobranchus kaupii]